MATSGRDGEIDWTQCELIERVPGKVSGCPVVRGTRVLPDLIVNSYDLGYTIEEIHEGFPTLSVTQIEQLISFAHAQRGEPEAAAVALTVAQRAELNHRIRMYEQNPEAAIPWQRVKATLSKKQ